MTDLLADIDQWRVFAQAVLVAAITSIVPAVFAWRSAQRAAILAETSAREESDDKKISSYYQAIRDEVDDLRSRMQAVEVEAEDQRGYIRELEDHVYELRALIKGLSPTTALPPVPQRKRRVQPPTK